MCPVAPFRALGHPREAACRKEHFSRTITSVRRSTASAPEWPRRMAAPFSLAAAPVAAISLPSVTNAQSATPTPNTGASAQPRLTFPKSRRILKRAEFRKVYDEGFKVPSSCFVAFCWKNPDLLDGSGVGFTTPRALGKATLRNRMKRRLRETIRRRFSALSPGWKIVWNLRRSALTVPQTFLDNEVERVFLRCKP